MMIRRRFTRLVLCVLCLGSFGASLADAAPLKIGYSDWPGWVAWDIGIEKGWFKKAGVDVEFIWFEYVPSMDAFAASKVDAVCMTNGDALVTGSTGKACKGILLNDYSNGNDMVVAQPGIRTIAQLKGKKVGVELGFVGHLLLLKGLEANGLSESDVTLVNMPTHETPQGLGSKQVDAIVAWQPNSGQALKAVPGSRPVYTSADSPGIIYDLLYVSNESLASRKDDWMKVTKIWYEIVDFIKDPENKTEVLKILSARVGLSPSEYEPLLAGTYLLTLEEAKARFAMSDGLGSVYGSTKIVDAFNVANKVYTKPEPVNAYFDPSLIGALK